MTEGVKNALTAKFEDIPIGSLQVRGLQYNVLKRLEQRGIERIGDLKGKSLEDLSNVIYIGDLGEILYIIGIEHKLDWGYLAEYPFISKENETIAKICEDPLNISIYNLDCPNTEDTTRWIRKAKKLKIADLIGKGMEIFGEYDIGPKTGEEICNALQIHGVIVRDGKFIIDLSIKDKYLEEYIAGSEEVTQSSADAAQELNELRRLTGRVITLPVEVIETVNQALGRIIENYDRGDFPHV